MTGSTFIAKEESDVLAKGNEFTRTLSLDIHTNLLRLAKLIVNSQGILLFLTRSEIEDYLYLGMILDKGIEHLNHSFLVPHLIGKFGSYIGKHYGFVGIDTFFLEVGLIVIALLISDTEGEVGGVVYLAFGLQRTCKVSIVHYHIISTTTLE